MFGDPKVQEQFRKLGDDPKKDVAIYADAVNAAIREVPDDMTVAIHTCRGNFKSTWLAKGGYDYVAETAFSTVDVDGFFLEFDDERSGGFEPLRYVPKGKKTMRRLCRLLSRSSCCRERNPRTETVALSSRPRPGHHPQRDSKPIRRDRPGVCRQAGCASPSRFESTRKRDGECERGAESSTTSSIDGTVRDNVKLDGAQIDTVLRSILMSQRHLRRVTAIRVPHSGVDDVTGGSQSPGSKSTKAV